jgi:hypothetical protein
MRSMFKSVLVAYLVAFALGAVGVSAAQATAPEWFQKGKVISKNIGFTSTGGAVTLLSGDSFKCTTEESTGEIEKPNKERKVTITLTGCYGENKVTGTKCQLKSKGAKGEEEIVTYALRGELGSVAKKEAASEVGFLLEGEAEAGTLAVLESTCFAGGGAALTGNVAGEVTPVHKEQTMSELIFAKNMSGEQNIQEIEVGKEKLKPKLRLRGLSAYLESTEKVTFAEAVEVT